ncbi:MAG: DMT family transporter, partial [Firmicutes bacterium]|nr:DMT family transporter [Bacillota bacterium]
AEDLGPWAFSGIRSIMGCLSMIPIIMFFDRRKSPEQKAAEHNPKLLLTGALICGIIVTTYMIPAQIGIALTTVGKSGFITSLYIIIVPVLGLFINRPVGKKIWACVFMAIAGFYLMSMAEGLSAINRGDMLILIGAFCCAFHIYAVDAIVNKIDPIKFTCLQFFFASIFCCAGAILFEKPTMDQVLAAIVPLLYTGICSCGLGYMFQTLGQKYVEPAKASLLFSSETVFTMAFGFLFFHEIMSGKEYFGCALIFAAIIISQIEPKKKEIEN